MTKAPTVLERPMVEPTDTSNPPTMSATSVPPPQPRGGPLPSDVLEVPEGGELIGTDAKANREQCDRQEQLDLDRIPLQEFEDLDRRGEVSPRSSGASEGSPPSLSSVVPATDAAAPWSSATVSIDCSLAQMLSRPLGPTYACSSGRIA